MGRNLGCYVGNMIGVFWIMRFVNEGFLDFSREFLQRYGHVSQRFGSVVYICNLQETKSSCLVAVYENAYRPVIDRPRMRLWFESHLGIIMLFRSFFPEYNNRLLCFEHFECTQ